MTRSVSVLLGLTMVVVLLPGCALTGVRQRSITAREAYMVDKDTEFFRSKLFEEGFTVLDPRLNVGQEAFSQAFVQGFLDAYQDVFQQESRRLGLVHPYVAYRRINRAKLTEEYAQAVRHYDLTGIMPSTTLDKLSKAVGVRYFGVPILISFQDKEYPRLTPFGFRMINTARATARFQLQIWDSKTNQIVWEGTSDSTLARDTFLEKPVRFREIVQATWYPLIKKIPPKNQNTRDNVSSNDQSE